ncbi:hypothetical protein PQX77_021412 [Marasmius sp. AFHP31]|nr:hypothetical protein PQX77_021412 [Marasmius sp. AFHP31]
MQEELGLIKQSRGDSVLEPDIFVGITASSSTTDAPFTNYDDIRRPAPALDIHRVEEDHSRGPVGVTDNLRLEQGNEMGGLCVEPWRQTRQGSEVLPPPNENTRLKVQTLEPNRLQRDTSLYTSDSCQEKVVRA